MSIDYQGNDALAPSTAQPHRNLSGWGKWLFACSTTMYLGLSNIGTSSREQLLSNAAKSVGQISPKGYSSHANSTVVVSGMNSQYHLSKTTQGLSLW